MIFEDFRKNYKGTAKSIMNNGDSIRVIHLVFGILVLVVGVFNSLLIIDRSGSAFIYLLLGSIIVGSTIISVGVFIRHLLYGLAEIVINTEITARNSCSPTNNEVNTPSKEDLPEL